MLERKMPPGQGAASKDRFATRDVNRAAIFRLNGRLGNCILCRDRIRLTSDPANCSSCRAWRKWARRQYSAQIVREAA